MHINLLACPNDSALRSSLSAQSHHLVEAKSGGSNVNKDGIQESDAKQSQRYRTGSQTTKTDQTQDIYEMVPLAHAAHCAVERERE
jgi:hypothetical protein